ncbi:outer membrane beta-barrel protein [Pontibacter sp. MBLB2868]|uniref:outer membrane beta-barrel protein n=1 Tax=Pontibacter sp. MBLB2868 TaxID=3451555 RepID=UPI003F752DE3
MNRFRYCFIILFFLIFTLPTAVSAQSSFLERVGRSNTAEKGIVIVGGVGMAAVKSSICGLPECNNFGPAVSVGALYKLSPYFAFGANLGYVRLGATEKDPNRPLNVTFQSEVVEVTGTVVLNLLDSYAGSGNYRSSRKRFVVPYVRGGAGFVYYTPTSFPGEGDLNDSQVTYDPARKYPAISAVIPFGGGLRFRFSDEFSIAPEMMYQVTLTNYLDNIATETSGTDHYAVASLKVIYTPIIKNKIFSKKY